MRAEVVAMDGEHLNEEAIKKAGQILKDGGSGGVSYRNSLRSGRKCP